MPTPAKHRPKAQEAAARRGVFSRLLPACAFLLALCALVTVVYGKGYGSLPPAEQRYSRAKNELDSLRSGSARAEQRESWLRVAQEFQEVYDLDPKWANRPAALYRKGESLHGLARRSGVQRDYQQAVAVFEMLAMRHAESRLADDALLLAAEMKARFLQDAAGALRCLARIRTQYAHGDALTRARELERSLKALHKPEGASSSGQSRPAGQSRSVPARQDGKLTHIAWKTVDARRVQIVVEVDRSVSWQASRKQAQRGAASLVLELKGAVPVAQIGNGARVTGSPLSAIRVETTPRQQTRLLFDFASLARYETRVEQEPFRIILDVFARESKAERRGKGAAENKPAPAQTRHAPDRQNARALAVTAPRDLAVQLGLGVQTVFIDAGHGGKDPGTAHNGVVERDVTLDVAKRVGKLLRNRGIDVQYSRGKDVYLSLGERTRIANAARADLFVSLHVNASVDTHASGFETFYLDIASNPEAARLATMENAVSDKKMGELTTILADFMLSARTQESRQLAGALQGAVLTRLSKHGHTVKNGGVKSAPLHVLIGSGMPAVLVELGYCSNREEARRLGSAAYRQSLAEGVAEGILAYRDKLLWKQTVESPVSEKKS